MLKGAALLILISVTPLFGQTKQETITRNLIGKWLFKEGQIVEDDVQITQSFWGLDTMTFESNNRYQWNRPCLDCDEKKSRKYIGEWSISSDGKSLLLVNISSDPYQAKDSLDKLGNKLRIQLKKDRLILYHTIYMVSAPNVPDEMKMKDGMRTAKIQYQRLRQE